MTTTTATPLATRLTLAQAARCARDYQRGLAYRDASSRGDVAALLAPYSIPAQRVAGSGKVVA